jgi:hypothetical protein
MKCANIRSGVRCGRDEEVAMDDRRLEWVAERLADATVTALFIFMLWAILH